MRRLGHAITVAGGLLVVAPVVVAIGQLAAGAGPSIMVDRAPTFMLGGLACFVVGILLREYG